MAIWTSVFVITLSKMREQEQQLTVFVTNGKNPSFREKDRTLETCTGIHELDTFPILTGFSEGIGGDINPCDFVDII